LKGRKLNHERQRHDNDVLQYPPLFRSRQLDLLADGDRVDGVSLLASLVIIVISAVHLCGLSSHSLSLDVIDTAKKETTTTMITGVLLHYNGHRCQIVIMMLANERRHREKMLSMNKEQLQQQQLRGH
jgi:hypothetical protein